MAPKVLSSAQIARLSGPNLAQALEDWHVDFNSHDRDLLLRAKLDERIQASLKPPSADAIGASPDKIFLCSISWWLRVGVMHIGHFWTSFRHRSYIVLTSFRAPTTSLQQQEKQQDQQQQAANNTNNSKINNAMQHNTKPCKAMQLLANQKSKAKQNNAIPSKITKQKEAKQRNSSQSIKAVPSRCTHLFQLRTRARCACRFASSTSP